MADQFDLASDIEALYTETAIAEQQAKAAKLSVQATGCCLFCDEPLEDGRRWCNSDCRDDWQLENPNA